MIYHKMIKIRYWLDSLHDYDFIYLIKNGFSIENAIVVIQFRIDKIENIFDLLISYYEEDSHQLIAKTNDKLVYFETETILMNRFTQELISAFQEYDSDINEVPLCDDLKGIIRQELHKMYHDTILTKYYIWFEHLFKCSLNIRIKVMVDYYIYIGNHLQNLDKWLSFTKKETRHLFIQTNYRKMLQIYQSEITSRHQQYPAFLVAKKFFEEHYFTITNAFFASS